MTEAFYLPENPDYTIVDSLLDSLRFVKRWGLAEYNGNTCGRSSFVNAAGEIMEWHDFGCVEGPGWAANSAGAAGELMRAGRFFGDDALLRHGESLLRHTLEDGFVDWETGLVRGYRDYRDDGRYLNYLHDRKHDDWLCPGSLAYIGVQLLEAADVCPDPALRERAARAAVLIGAWIASRVQLLPSGWMPRRCTPEGAPYSLDAYGKREDPIFAISGDGLFAIRLAVELTQRGLADHGALARTLTDAFVRAGGHFGSINHDTYDPSENVAYSVAFRTLRRAAALAGDAALTAFAFDRCLAALEGFEIREDHNQVACKGLLWMEATWTTAYLWESAEASWAYLEAWGDTGKDTYLSKALTLLRAIARHHHGPDGFLTEGCDWNGHLPQYLWHTHGTVRVAIHFDDAVCGDILYTEPLLNNMHIAAPTLLYLEAFARSEPSDEGTAYFDHEGNPLWVRPATDASPSPEAAQHG